LVEPPLSLPTGWPVSGALDEIARKLVAMFRKNFIKYEQTVDADVRATAPEFASRPTNSSHKRIGRTA